MSKLGHMEGKQHFSRPRNLLPTNRSVLSEDMQTQWKSQRTWLMQGNQKVGAKLASFPPGEFHAPNSDVTSAGVPY